MPIHFIRGFLQTGAAGGIVLMVSAALALIAKNSPFEASYDALLAFPLSIGAGNYALTKPLLLWVNDGLMAIFFLLIGLELKREMKEGHLSHPSQNVFPAIGALGGMAVPALIYVAVNRHDPSLLRGWAIPAATDIAFALGVLSLCGRSVPVPLKLFLTSLAVFDDIGAIVIIALFYADDLSPRMLSLSACVLIALAGMNVFRVRRLAPYLLLGTLLWFCVLKSGIHATIAGVLLAFAIPLRTGGKDSPLLHLERSLYPWVYYMIMPLFGFVNAGLSFSGVSMEVLLHPVTLGVGGGLFLGKQIGVMLFCWILTKTRVAKLPAGVSWRSFYGICLLTGIGFTMSLFVGSLAFDAPGVMDKVKLGILAGSLLSALAGYAVLRAGPEKPVRRESRKRGPKITAVMDKRSRVG